MDGIVAASFSRHTIINGAQRLLKPKRSLFLCGILFSFVMACVIAIIAAQAFAQPVEWRQRATTGGPGPLVGHSLAYDSLRGVTVLFGGLRGDGTPPSADTWEWNGITWTLREVTGPRPYPYYPAMTFDSARGVTVLVTHGNGVGKTWEWDGTVWSEKLVQNPPILDGAAIAYDAGRGVTVLFGGIDSSTGSYSDQTWEWNGVAWHRNLVVGPSGRVRPEMEYDATRHLIIMSGGSQMGSYDNQLWEWNGSAWRQGIITGRGSLSYDTRREVMIGWIGDSNNPYPQQTWQLDGGTNWTELAVSGPPGRRGFGKLVFDSVRGVSVLFGGLQYNDITGVYNGLGDTWEFGTPCVAPTITAQPADRSILWRTGRAKFTVGTNGSAPVALQWQWRPNSNATWYDIVEGINTSPFNPRTHFTAAGSTTGSVVISSLSPALTNAVVHWEYRCVVSNSCGTITSNPATLTICGACRRRGDPRCQRCRR